MKITTNTEKSTTKTPFIEPVDGPYIIHSRGGRTIEENENRQLFGLMQGGYTKILENLAFGGRHG